MRIRTITYFCNPGWPGSDTILKEAGIFIRSARNAYTGDGFEVQSTRIATIPFPDLIPLDHVASGASSLESIIQSEGFDNLSLGPALPDQLASFPTVIEGLAATTNTFFSGMVTQPVSIRSSGIFLPALRSAAQVIERASTLSPDGFANLRFAVLANVPAGSPFFPAAYHTGSEPSFALGMEAAELAVTAFGNSTTLKEARILFRKSIEENAHRLEDVGHQLEKTFSIQFKGLDFSLAPFPEEQRSIGAAFEHLGVPMVGLAGTLASAAILTESLDRARFTRTGFNGLMLPVLEDVVLSTRAAMGILTVKDLLMCSAVCGTGLDTIPIPGDTPSENIAALLLDLATLALRLNKPLTARLMPIPGKSAGDATNFTFPYFSNSRILTFPALPLQGFLAGDELIEIKSLYSTRKRIIS